MHCKIKESLMIRDLQPTLNENLGSEKLYFLVVLCQSILLVPSPYNEWYFLNLNLSVTEK